jgi:hypothetical protein
MYNKLYYLLPVFILLAAAGCEKKDPIIPNDEELITTVQLFKTFEVKADSLVAVFRDLDGSGGNDPEISHPVFNANSSYQLKLVFLNETVNPADDINIEIADESEDHQIFFLPDENLKLSYSYYDQDENGNPLGLNIILQTGESSSGEWKIVLRHMPDKFGSGVANGLIEQAGGETDIEIVFDATIQ